MTRSRARRFLDRMKECCLKTNPRDWTETDCYLVVVARGEDTPHTKAEQIAAMRAFWAWAEEMLHVQRSPAKKMATPVTPEYSLPYVSIPFENVSSLREHMIPKAYSLSVVAWATGLKPSNIMRLRPQDVDETGGAIHTINGNRPKYSAPVVDSEVFRFALDHIESIAGRKIPPKKKVSVKWYNEQVNTAAREVGLPLPFELFHFRSAYIFRLIDRKVSPLSIMAWTGISKFFSLEKYYRAAGVPFDDTLEHEGIEYEKKAEL
jgi:integrase